MPAWSYPSATVHWEIEHPNGSYSDVQLDKRVAMDLEGNNTYNKALCHCNGGYFNIHIWAWFGYLFYSRKEIRLFIFGTELII